MDAGGQAFGKTVDSSPVSFRMRDNAPVAYVDLDFTDGGKVSPIREVIVGPKNDVLQTGVSIFLETSKVPSAEVKRSSASYR